MLGGVELFCPLNLFKNMVFIFYLQAIYSIFPWSKIFFFPRAFLHYARLIRGRFFFSRTVSNFFSGSSKIWPLKILKFQIFTGEKRPLVPRNSEMLLFFGVKFASGCRSIRPRVSTRFVATRFVAEKKTRFVATRFVAWLKTRFAATRFVAA